MLQMFRDSMKYLAWILWVVIAVFVLFVFVDFGRGSSYGDRGGAHPAATVGKQTISYREYEQEYRQIEDQMRQRLGQQYTPEMAEQLRIPMQALNRLVSRKILLAEADKLDLAVSDKELRSYILHLPVFQDPQGACVGADGYQRVVRRLGFTPESFEQSMREQMMLQRIVGALERSVVVTDQEVEARFREGTEKAKLRYVAVPLAASAAPVAVSDAELQRYFDQHKEELRLPEQRVADYLLVDQAALEGSLQLSDADLRAYYQQHQAEYAQPEQAHARHILVPTQEEAAAVQARLAAGEDFAKVAKETSKDTTSAVNGGDLGWLPRGRTVPEFEKALFDSTIGVLVGPVKTQFGYHLIEVLERRPGSTTPYEQVQQAVRTRLAAERSTQVAEQKAKTLAAELTKAGAGARQKMTELAKQPGLETGSTEPFSRQGVVAPLGNAPELNAVGFQLQKGALSAPIRTPRGWVVLHLAEVKPAHLPELAEVKDAVRRGAEEEKQRQQAFQRLEAAKAKVGAGAGLDALAAELGVPVQETQEFGHGGVVPGIGYAPELAKAAMELPLGTVAGPTVASGNAYLYQVASRSGADPAVFAQQKDGLRQQLEQEQINAVVTSLVNARKQELGVTYDPQLLKTMGLDGQPGQRPQRG
jgi:peptidyl-prolyl cis-trans isomerase D